MKTYPSPIAGFEEASLPNQVGRSLAPMTTLRQSLLRHNEGKLQNKIVSVKSIDVAANEAIVKLLSIQLRSQPSTYQL